MTTVIVPAHNEAGSIGATLDALRPQLDDDDELLVVCNGCTDGTADIARARAPEARVVEIATPSKAAALDAGDEQASSFPRLYLDADIELAPGSLDALASALEDGGLWLASPRARHVLAESTAPVRSYYRIWSRLPSVRDDTVGKGCYAVNAQGRACFDRFADVLGDDHFVRDAVPPARRRVVADAVSTIQAPRTLPAVLRRKVRTLEGNAALDRTGEQAVRRARSRQRQWLGVVAECPPLALDLPVFLGVSLSARALVMWRRRRGREGVEWSRDDTH